MTPWSDNHSEIKVNGTPWCHITHFSFYTAQTDYVKFY